MTPDELREIEERREKAMCVVRGQTFTSGEPPPPKLLWTISVGEDIPRLVAEVRKLQIEDGLFDEINEHRQRLLLENWKLRRLCREAARYVEHVDYSVLLAAEMRDAAKEDPKP